MVYETNPFEVGDKLRYTGIIKLSSLFDGNEDLPMDAVERDVTVEAVDSDGIVYIKYGDGLEDDMPWQNLDSEDYERVTWDTMTS